MKKKFANIILIIISIIFILCILNNLFNDNIVSKNIVDKFSGDDEKQQLKNNLRNLEKRNIDDKINNYGIIDETDVTKNFGDNDFEIAMDKFWFHTDDNGNKHLNDYFFLLNNNTRSQYRVLLRATNDNDNNNEIHFSNNMYPLSDYLLHYSDYDKNMKFYKDKYIYINTSSILKIDYKSTSIINFEGINNNGVYDNILNIKINDKYIKYNDNNLKPVVDNKKPNKYQFRRINFDDPKMLDIIPDYYSKDISIPIDDNGTKIGLNVKTLIDYKNNNFSVVNQNLRQLSLTRGVNDVLEDNLMNRIRETDIDLYNINQYLDVFKNSPDRLINKIYVQNVLDYKNFKDEKIFKKIYGTDKEDFQNLNNTENIDGNINNDINKQIDSNLYSKDLVDSLFPQNPIDFFGVYIIKFSNYLLLDNIKIILKEKELVIKDKNDKEIKSFIVRKFKKLTIPEFPNQTISLALDDKYEYNEKYDNIENLLIGKQRELLDNINFKDIIYLFGNDGKYTFYTQNRNILFNVVKIE